MSKGGGDGAGIPLAAVTPQLRGQLQPIHTWRSAIVESELPPTTRLVALVLSLHMNERGGSCFPSQETLARESGLTARAVREHLHRLRDEGWLSVEVDRKGKEMVGGGRYRTTHWVATTPARNPERGSGYPASGGEGAGQGGARNPEPETRNEVPPSGETRNLKGGYPEPEGRVPGTVVPTSSSIAIQEQSSSSASPTQGAKAAESFVAAKAIVTEWWESPDRQPTATAFIAIVKRVQACLDGGYRPEDVSAALRRLRVFTTGSFEWQLSRLERTAAPETWDVLERRMAVHDADDGVLDAEALPA